MGVRGAINLTATVRSAVEGHIDEVHAATLEDVRDVTKGVAASLRRGGPYRSVSGRYAASWRYQVKESAVGTTGTVYSKGQAGLTHLLELGHRVAPAGHARPYPHIAPAYGRGAEELLRKMGVR